MSRRYLYTPSKVFFSKDNVKVLRHYMLTYFPLRSYRLMNQIKSICRIKSNSQTVSEALNLLALKCGIDNLMDLEDISQRKVDHILELYKSNNEDFIRNNDLNELESANYNPTVGDNGPIDVNS